ncbi:hypothetical protein [Leadbetterella byssophila]|uniref:hypothetical protein n=1 Tax=Leadbetterella byssophila TaxID=316068 RepID=UPI0039A2C929
MTPAIINIILLISLTGCFAILVAFISGRKNQQAYKEASRDVLNTQIKELVQSLKSFKMADGFLSWKHRIRAYARISTIC